MEMNEFNNTGKGKFCYELFNSERKEGKNDEFFTSGKERKINFS